MRGVKYIKKKGYSIMDSIFTAVAHLTEKLGPLSTLLDTLIEHIAPHASAEAFHCGDTLCTNQVCNNGRLLGSRTFIGDDGKCHAAGHGCIC